MRNTKSCYACVNEDNEYILPSQFLPIAEQTGQMAEIDRWVIKHAIGKLAEHRAKASTHSFS